MAEPVRLIAVLDGLRLGFTTIPLYSLVFYCRAVGGELSGHPLETRAVGWFAEDALPAPLAGADRWAPTAFSAIRGDQVEVLFDPPRDPLVAPTSPDQGRSWRSSPSMIEVPPSLRSHSSAMAAWSTRPATSGRRPRAAVVAATSGAGSTSSP